MINISRVFSTGFAMFRQRFWLLAGMWVVFFAIQMVATIGLVVLIAVMGLAGVTAFGLGFDDPATMTGMGAGLIALIAVFYAAYVAILLAQQAALTMLASPLERPVFGTAMVRGFRSVLPFLGLFVILILGYVAISIGLALLIGATSLASDSGSGVLALVLALLAMPVMIYLTCRLAVLVPVVAVDEVYNPFKALRRSWRVTSGKVIGILLVGIGIGLLGLVGLGAPMALVFASLDAAGPDLDGVAMVALLMPFVLLPIFVIYTLFIAAVIAALHSEVTQGGAEKLEEVFA